MPPAPPPRPARLGVVLAAGAGTRYGSPKIHAAQGDWLRQAITALSDGGCDAVSVCVGAAHAHLPPGVAAIDVPRWMDGMSASVHAALAGAEDVGARQVVLHLVDLPDVGAGVVARVVAGAGDDPGVLARATYGGRPGHPVLIGSAHWPALAASLTGDAGGRAYLGSRNDLLLVECGDLATGRDIDRPQSSGDPRPGVPQSPP